MRKSSHAERFDAADGEAILAGAVLWLSSGEAGHSPVTRNVSLIKPCSSICDLCMHCRKAGSKTSLRRRAARRSRDKAVAYGRTNLPMAGNPFISRIVDHSTGSTTLSVPLDRPSGLRHRRLSLCKKHLDQFLPPYGLPDLPECKERNKRNKQHDHTSEEFVRANRQ